MRPLEGFAYTELQVSRHSYILSSMRQFHVCIKHALTSKVRTPSAPTQEAIEHIEIKTTALTMFCTHRALVRRWAEVEYVLIIGLN